MTLYFLDDVERSILYTVELITFVISKGLSLWSSNSLRAITEEYWRKAT